MKHAAAYLMLICVAGAFVGLWIIASPEPPPKTKTDSDEVARLKQEIRYRDAIIARQREIIESNQKK